MKRVSIAVLVTVVLSIQHGARAQAVYGQLMTVDEVKFSAAGFQVVGIVQGESSPTYKNVVFAYGTDAEKAVARENCARLLLLAMSKPGQYLFHVTEEGTCALRIATP